MMAANTARSIRADLQLIADMIEPHSRLLDVGCGDGTLLEYLDRHKHVDGRGIEISTQGVDAWVLKSSPRTATIRFFWRRRSSTGC